MVEVREHFCNSNAHRSTFESLSEARSLKHVNCEGLRYDETTQQVSYSTPMINPRSKMQGSQEALCQRITVTL